jgi:hypothetical protein
MRTIVGVGSLILMITILGLVIRLGWVVLAIVTEEANKHG